MPLQASRLVGNVIYSAQTLYVKNKPSFTQLRFVWFSRITFYLRIYDVNQVGCVDYYMTCVEECLKSEIRHLSIYVKFVFRCNLSTLSYMVTNLRNLIGFFVVLFWIFAPKIRLSVECFTKNMIMEQIQASSSLIRQVLSCSGDLVFLIRQKNSK